MRTAATLFRSTHPAPTVTVTLIALGLGFSVGLPPMRLAVLVIAVLLGQVSIGLSNDVIDAPRDREVGRTDKPLARPGAPLCAAWVLAVVSGIAALALSALLGWAVTFAHLLFIGSGWAYNVLLKSTVWSAACFVVGFGVFPSLAPLSLLDPALVPAWASVAGAAFGVAVHFSNVIPDLDDDRRTGVRGLPHRIGERPSAVVAFGALIIGAAVVALVSGAEALPWAVFALIAVVAVTGLGVTLRRGASRLAFRLVMFAALLLAVQLVVIGGLAP